MTQAKPVYSYSSSRSLRVFGREVHGFRSIDYDAISMLNVSATQQLKKEKDEEVKALRDESMKLKAEMYDSESRFDQLA